LDENQSSKTHSSGFISVYQRLSAFKKTYHIKKHFIEAVKDELSKLKNI